MPVYVETQTVTLPYPGLRPFRRDEFEIFFGREEHVTKLAEMLQEHHFVAVVGPSGCGKSSLVTAGLLPELAAGHSVDIEGAWYEATIRPGDRPFSRLAKALIESGAMPDYSDDDMTSRIGFLDAMLRRGPLGLIEALDGAQSLNEGNLLIVVDQFEEIFRFRHEQDDQEADAFIAMLLETVRQADQRKLPIYVMLTMRSDYLGNCNQFSGLPEAISESQFLTPRPNRQQRHAAIVGPASMFGGEVEPALVNRLLNDMGDDPDQLPIMQHALMRMWSLKSLGVQHQGGDQQATPSAEQDDQPVLLTTDIYDEVGGWHNTLSNHADEALEGLVDDPECRRVAKMLFRSLIHRGPNQNDVRRPVSVQEVADVAGVSTEIVKEVVNAFRRADRCFLTPGIVEGDPRCNELADDDILDISHESLIRQWDKLRALAQNEGDSAADYVRLEDSARRWQSGDKGFLQSPELDVLLKRYQDEQWTPIWARRYGDDFELAMRYLEESQTEKQRLDAEAEAHRNELAGERARADQQARTVVRFRRYMAVIAIVSLLFAAAAAWAFFAQREAVAAQKKAELAQRDAEVAQKAEQILKEFAREETEKAKAALKIAEAKTTQLETAQQDVKNKLKRLEAQANQLEIAKQNAENKLKRLEAQAIQLETAQQELSNTRSQLATAEEQLRRAQAASGQAVKNGKLEDN